MLNNIFYDKKPSKIVTINPSTIPMDKAFYLDSSKGSIKLGTKADLIIIS